MEELLKAYANKRRQEGGDSFAMHPVTRKLLQAGVARRWPKRAERSPSFFQLLLNFWPRLAFAALGCLAVAGLVIWVSNPGQNRQKEFARIEKKPALDSYSDRDTATKDSPAAATAPAPAEKPAKRPEAAVAENRDGLQQAQAVSNGERELTVNRRSSAVCWRSTER